MIRAILFDLDGTLLPVHNDFFFRDYLAQISAIIPGREPQQVAGAIMGCLRDVMRENQPGVTVEQRFARGLSHYLNMPYAEQEPRYMRYYQEEFPKLGTGIQPMPQVRAALEAARARGVQAVLATNPVFPGVATRERMRWAGVSEADFSLVTYYEDCCFTKPHTAYYAQEVLARLHLRVEECLMVGNDAIEDMAPAKALGMRTFLLTPFAIGAQGRSGWDAEGDYDAMLACVEEMLG